MNLTAAHFEERLQAMRSEAEREKYSRYFKMGPGEYGEGDVFIGVPMGKVFALAKEFIQMEPDEIERLMESEIHECRAGAMSIMNQQARQTKLPESRRQELYDLYLRRHDRVNNWDLVDLAAMHVIGRHLLDKPRDVLYTLARSENHWERRTAITAPVYFLNNDEYDDLFALAEILVNDPHDLVQKAVGGWIRQAGKSNPERLFAFLDQHAPKMQRVMLRYAIEKLSPEQRKHYMCLKAGS